MRENPRKVPSWWVPPKCLQVIVTEAPIACSCHGFTQGRPPFSDEDPKPPRGAPSPPKLHKDLNAVPSKSRLTLLE